MKTAAKENNADILILWIPLMEEQNKLCTALRNTLRLPLGRLGCSFLVACFLSDAVEPKGENLSLSLSFVSAVQKAAFFVLPFEVTINTRKGKTTSDMTVPFNAPVSQQVCLHQHKLRQWTASEAAGGLS